MENLKIGDIGYYDSIECEIINILDEITIEVWGKFKYASFNYPYYKNFFHRFFNIPSYSIIEHYNYDTKIISSYNFKKNNE